MLWQAVGGVHVQQLNLAGSESRMLCKARLPPHIPCVQYHLQHSRRVRLRDLMDLS